MESYLYHDLSLVLVKYFHWANPVDHIIVHTLFCDDNEKLEINLFWKRHTCFQVINILNYETHATVRKHFPHLLPITLPNFDSSNAYTLYICNGVLHRDDDLPAMESVNTSKHWFVNGLRHRIQGPASYYQDGHTWYKYGKKHCEARDPITHLLLPASVLDDVREWWWEGRVHMTDCDAHTGLVLPAVVSNKRHEWWKHGKQHRTCVDPGNGLVLPAVIGSEENYRTCEWWYEGQMHRTCIDSKTGLVLPALSSKHRYQWCLHGQLHRMDRDPITKMLLPAKIEQSTLQLRQQWWIYGKQIFSIFENE